MPLVGQVGSIKIRMHYNDGNERHHKSHVHAEYQEQEASYSLNGEKLGGNLPLKQEKKVKEWMKENKNELENNWNKAKNFQTFDRIRGDEKQETSQAQTKQQQREQKRAEIKQDEVTQRNNQQDQEKKNPQNLTKAQQREQNRAELLKQAEHQRSPQKRVERDPTD